MTETGIGSDVATTSAAPARSPGSVLSLEPLEGARLRPHLASDSRPPGQELLEGGNSSFDAN